MIVVIHAPLNDRTLTVARLIAKVVYRFCGDGSATVKIEAP